VSALGFFLTWWGVFLLAALDASLLVFLPFGIDAAVIYMAARHRETFYVYALIATAGSIAGAAFTYWVGRKAGEAGLERHVSARRLEALKRRVRDAGALAMAIPAALPPPFPLTPFVLTCGALEVSPARLAIAFGTARLLRFMLEASLASIYGRRVLFVLESPAFAYVIGGFMVMAIAGTAISVVALWRRTR
jgi:membrane protein YqaA with SNARE-associated domain